MTEATDRTCVRHNGSPLWIGSVRVDPPVLMAPLAGFTDHAFRETVREFGGAGLLTTEMVSARGLMWRPRTDAEESQRLWGVRQEARPLAVQIWDNDSGRLAWAGGRLARHWQVSVVDINLGCPARRVADRAKSGAYLLRHPSRIERIVGRVVRACAPVPVTAKIRLGPTRETVNAVDVAQAVELAGAAAVTVHGRTAEDHLAGRADWDRIAEVKRHVSRIAVIGNGDLDGPNAVVQAFRRYAVDGVMIGRAALGRPWLFQQIRAALGGMPIPPEPSIGEQQAILLRHYQRVLDRCGEEKGTMLMRRYACCYVRGHRGARCFRTHVAKAATAAEFRAIVQRYFPQRD